MRDNLFKAILAIDSYYRGYEAGIKLTEPMDTVGEKIGNATILTEINDSAEKVFM